MADNTLKCPSEYKKDVQEMINKIGDHNKMNGSSLYEWSLKDFEIGRPLGRGKFGRVYLAREKNSHFLVALKVIFKSQIKQYRMESQVIHEIEINTRLRHPNIIRLLTYFHDKKRIFLVLEYAGGGEMYRNLQHQVGKKFSEAITAKYVLQVADALEYCHQNNVIHRDIKPENILLSIDGNIKIGDFGWSVHAPVMKRSTMCGTIDYLPPEMVENKIYDEKIDIWCLGVLCYELLVGKAPFETSSQTSTFTKIKAVDMKYPINMSEGAKDLISKLLKYNPKDRLPLTKVKKHFWIREMQLDHQKKNLKF